MPRMITRRGPKKKKKKRVTYTRETKCRFCRGKVKEIDYKELQTLIKLTTTQGKIFSRKRSGNCAGHQRQVQAAIKLARFMAMLPFIG